MKRIISILLVLIFALSMLPFIISCKRVDDEQAKEIVKDLVGKSYELNVIYFGAGLKHTIEEGNEDLYIRVDEDAAYQKKKPLVEMTRKVFSEKYAQSMITTAFVGLSGGIEGSGAFARYIEDYDGILTIRKDSQIIDVEIATYDFSTIKIVKNSKNQIIARIMTNNLDVNQEVQIYLVYEKDSWKIDSATY